MLLVALSQNSIVKHALNSDTPLYIDLPKHFVCGCRAVFAPSVSVLFVGLWAAKEWSKFQGQSFALFSVCTNYMYVNADLYLCMLHELQQYNYSFLSSR
jgi:hypothetical protein